MGIVEELKGEHQLLLQLFKAIEEDKFVNKELVEKLKRAAIVHLRKEDEQLYPTLAKSKHLEISPMAKTFADAMKGYSEKFIIVVDKILEAEGEPKKEIIEKFEDIRDRIKDRIVIEESILFPAYDQS